MFSCLLQTVKSPILRWMRLQHCLMCEILTHWLLLWPKSGIDELILRVCNISSSCRQFLQLILVFIIQICFKITHLKLQPHLSGANELALWVLKSEYSMRPKSIQCTPDISRLCISRNWKYRNRMLDPIFWRSRVRYFSRNRSNSFARDNFSRNLFTAIAFVPGSL